MLDILRCQKRDIPQKRVFVFYNCMCSSHKRKINYGHFGISLGDGLIIHALDIEKSTAIIWDG